MKNLTQNALAVLQKRYLMRDGEGKIIETPEQLFKRVAKAVASVEKTPELRTKYEEKYFQLMATLNFLPNTPTLLNAGRPGKYCILSACFVLPIEDSLDGIFTTLHRSAILHQQGAGTGYNFSRLRPEGSIVSRKTGVSSGPVSFMKVFNAAVEEVKQGSTRRGAMMHILNCDHPDILKFIQCKMDESQIRNANISVAVTDEFLHAVEQDKDWVLSHPSSSEKKNIKARDLWNKIIECAWAKGDPGLFFVDEANRYNPVPHVYTIEATNPCGEVPMGPNEACNLGSINLANFVIKDNNQAKIDWDSLKEAIHTSVRFLDDVIDLSKFPFEDIEKMVKGNRKIGLGVMGFHDTLIQLGVKYDSEEGLKIADKLGFILQKEADQASIDLGKEKGSFPNFKGSRYDGKFDTLRNCTRTVIAPTGTISLIANETSSGIEPVFAFNHKSNRMDTQMTHKHPFVEQWELQHPNKPLPDYCKEAQEIDPAWHVRMQAVWQQYINDAVSKTINLPNSATQEDIAKIYMMAWKLHTKGITIYRDGCRTTGQVLEHAKSESPKAFGEEAKYYERATGYGALHVNIAHTAQKEPYRVFINIPPLGTEISGMASCLGIVVSKFLEKGGKLEELIKHLGSVTGDKPIGLGQKKVLSIPHALAGIFREFLKNSKAKAVPMPETNSVLHCPECYSSDFHKQEGCSLCSSCGYSSCS